MVEWRIYGCGSASSNQYLQTSYEIIDKETRLQIDFGNGSLYQRCRVEGGIEKALDSVTHLFFTHAHPDHTVDLTRHAVAWKYTPGYSPGKPVHIYATQVTLNRIQRMLDNAGLDEMFQSVYTPHPVALNTPVEIGSLTVSAFHVDHTEGSVGFRIKTLSGQQIVFTGDTGPSTNMETCLKDLDLLVIECSFFSFPHHMHLKLDQIGGILQNNNPGAVILVHFYPEMENKTIKQIQSFLKKHYAGPVYAGADGQKYKWVKKDKLWKISSMF